MVEEQHEQAKRRWPVIPELDDELPVMKWRLAIAFVTILLCAAVLAPACWWAAQHISSRPAAHLLSRLSAARRAVLRRPIVWRQADRWLGEPPPQPAHIARETPAYQAWRANVERLALRLQHRKYTAAATALCQWLTATDARVARGAAGAPAPPAALRRLLRGKIAAPPAPASVPFYGYKVVLPWNHAAYYYAADAVPLKSPYLLHPNGVTDSGTPVRAREDVLGIFTSAGVRDPAARDVLIRVSGQEGGFDAVNTWDTGYVSVGFIQFTTGESGAGHSLLRVLQRMKESEAARRGKHADEFQTFFANHGIDVQDDELCVRDPLTRKTCIGADAVNLIINDKRLTAIFQDAGAKSRAFQLAQVREAYGAYYLARCPFRIPVVEVRSYAPAEQSAPPPAVKVATPPTPTLAPTPAQRDGALLAEAKPGDTAAVPLAQETPVKPELSEPPAPAPAAPRVVATQYIYGEQAVRVAMAEAETPAQFRRGKLPSRGGRLYRVARRMPDLVGVYGDVLRTEGGRVTLTDRAVQHGVHNAAETFVAALNGIHADHPLTARELSAHETEIIGALKNRIDVLGAK